jgi:hypothetical protein
MPLGPALMKGLFKAAGVEMIKTLCHHSATSMPVPSLLPRTPSWQDSYWWKTEEHPSYEQDSRHASPYLIGQRDCGRFQSTCTDASEVSGSFNKGVGVQRFTETPKNLTRLWYPWGSRAGGLGFGCSYTKDGTSLVSLAFQEKERARNQTWSIHLKAWKQSFQQS